ncbi:hypothetical protein SAMN06273572_101185 [Monaibacterium marinum]|uniref:Uncharacterized protein n=2 Tax=Pontivivens marinum TaxID=1690039 RepID=A0A2C9CM77_9RHOB|nr:hypothetical protein SAMN06273572_101185 [Monaibacterium marinum]
MYRIVSYRQPRQLGWVILFALSGCMAIDVGPLPENDGVVREFLFTPNQQPLVSDSIDDITEIAQRATRNTPDEIAERTRTEEIRLDQLAYFFRSQQGQSYLLGEGPKAMVRGYPAAQCPVQTVVLAGGTTQDAISQALSTCHAELAQLDRTDDCGCSLLAYENVLHASPAEFEYAIDLPVRLFRNGQLDPTTYFSRSGTDGNGDEAITIEVAQQRLMVISFTDGTSDEAIVSFADGTQAAAERVLVGYDRGRIRQSFTLTEADGRRLRIIVGP